MKVTDEELLTIRKLLDDRIHGECTDARWLNDIAALARTMSDGITELLERRAKDNVMPNWPCSIGHLIMDGYCVRCGVKL